MKRVFSHSALVALLLLLPSAAMGWTLQVDGLFFEISNGKASVVSNPNGEHYSGDIVIPDSISSSASCRS